MKKITSLLLVLGCSFLVQAKNLRVLETANLCPVENLKLAVAVKPDPIIPLRVLPKSFNPLAPLNDDCSNATAITALPYSFEQTDGATATNNAGFITACEDDGMNDGVWYTIVGTGGSILVSISPEEDYDAKLGIFTGNCSALQCEGTIDYFSAGGNETFLISNSIVGTTYYINIGYYSDSEDELEGNFTINVEAVETPANDYCASAIAVTSLPYSHEQTDGIGATNNEGFITVCEEDAMNDGVWYTVAGTGSAISVIVSPSETFDPQLGIYSGSCAALECVGTMDNGFEGEGESYTISSSEVGTTYYINVGNFSGFTDNQEGNFTISIVGDSALTNDSCLTATNITTFPYNTAVDASSATNNDGIITACTNGMNDGIWYQVNGNGSDITVSATSFDWDGQLGIYTGSCGELTCYDTVDNEFGGTAETIVITASEQGVVYYINFGDYDQEDDYPEGLAAIEVTTTALGVGNNKFKDFVAYPNPVKNTLNLSYSDTITAVSVFNLLGQQVMAKPANADLSQIDMSGMASGTYMVKVTAADAVKTIKVIKE